MKERTTTPPTKTRRASSTTTPRRPNPNEKKSIPPRTRSSAPVKNSSSGSGSSGKGKNKKGVKSVDSTRVERFTFSIIKKLLTAPIVDDATGALKDATQSKVASASLGAEEVRRLATYARQSFLAQNSLIRINDSGLPLTIVADIHGQYVHLRSVFAHFGSPHQRCYLFLGDYVDRGIQGVECFCLLIAMKVRYPKRIFLLRGNHEDANTTLSYGFQDECMNKFGEEGMKTWKALVSTFDTIPFAALINGKILCMHGGLSPFMDNVDDIDKISRPTIVPPYGLACDLVWSDPSRLHPGWSLSGRGTSFTFDDDVVKEFCKRNKLDLIVRGHQLNNEMLGTGYSFFSSQLVTVFSAPNYINNGNSACVLNLNAEMKLTFHVFRSPRLANPRKKTRREKAKAPKLGKKHKPPKVRKRKSNKPPDPAELALQVEMLKRQADMMDMSNKKGTTPRGAKADKVDEMATATSDEARSPLVAATPRDSGLALSRSPAPQRRQQTPSAPNILGGPKIFNKAKSNREKEEDTEVDNIISDKEDRDDDQS